MTTLAVYPVTMSVDPGRTAAFYRQLLDLSPTFVADWYVSLAAPGSGAQFATVARDHPSVPAGFRTAPAGSLVTVEVNDAAAVWATALSMDAEVELELRDEAWGQRHFLLRDPDGLLVDVIESIPPTGQFVEQYTNGQEPSVPTG